MEMFHSPEPRSLGYVLSRRKSADREIGVPGEPSLLGAGLPTPPKRPTVRSQGSSLSASSREKRDRHGASLRASPFFSLRLMRLSPRSTRTHSERNGAEVVLALRVVLIVTFTPLEMLRDLMIICVP